MNIICIYKIKLELIQIDTIKNSYALIKISESLILRSLVWCIFPLLCIKNLWLVVAFTRSAGSRLEKETQCTCIWRLISGKLCGELFSTTFAYKQVFMTKAEDEMSIDYSQCQHPNTYDNQWDNVTLYR